MRVIRVITKSDKWYRMLFFTAGIPVFIILYEKNLVEVLVAGSHEESYRCRRCCRQAVAKVWCCLTSMYLGSEMLSSNY